MFVCPDKGRPTRTHHCPVPRRPWKRSPPIVKKSKGTSSQLLTHHACTPHRAETPYRYVRMDLQVWSPSRAQPRPTQEAGLVPAIMDTGYAPRRQSPEVIPALHTRPTCSPGTSTDCPRTAWRSPSSSTPAHAAYSRHPPAYPAPTPPTDHVISALPLHTTQHPRSRPFW